MEGMEGLGYWRGRSVLVTGATGLLGSWLCRDLADAGAAAVALVRDGVPESNFHRLGLDRRVTRVSGAIEDYALLERTLNEYETDTVFHLAAQTIVGVGNRNPLSTFEANIRGTWSLLEACRRNPLVRRIVVSTSDKAYGEHAKLPYVETTPLQGRHPYDVSKSCADLLCQAYAHSFGSPVVIMRCANLFGGGDLNFNRLVPGTIRSALQGERPVIRSDGRFIRDYLYAPDAARGFLLAARSLEKKKLSGQAFNLGLGLRIEALDLARRILRLMDLPDMKPRVLDRASNEIRRQYLSPLKARKVLGWTPEHTLDEALVETVAWYREHLRP